MPANILDRILAVKQQEIADLKSRHSASELNERMLGQAPVRSLSSALRSSEAPGIIAEIKKASPSEGIIRPDFDPETIAAGYRANGAAALSILTDGQFFQGRLPYLEAVRPQIDLPLLRKDFIIDPLQIMESRAAGADAILLIVAALAQTQLKDLLETSRSVGLEALVEVHDLPEMVRALDAGATLIGVNNRDLKTFRTDLATTETLAGSLSREHTLVAESGIKSGEDAARMVRAGAQGILVGTHLMRGADPGLALKALREDIRRCCA
ncbi:MAG: indole-3-glycerol phosphate synthase TrpC [Calditrichaeota bacterium]|nr:indole-3-glycerol phosphate synthase TrpC [Calditrichota bacterium]HQU72306.1 indole-3-glycerol phosphate synthase TrpC [Calditrichia bacterium]